MSAVLRPNWFVGLPLPDSWVSAALRGVPTGLRTFRGEDIHMTVAFLGACGEAAALRGWRALVDAEGGSPRPLGGPFHVTLGAVLPFGDPSCPSSLSVVPADPDDRSKSFIETHQNRIRVAAGLAPERRPVRPHVTIVRIKRRAPPPQRDAALDWAASVRPLGVTVPVREVGLYTWTADRRSQLFHIVRRAPLSVTGP